MLVSQKMPNNDIIALQNPVTGKLLSLKELIQLHFSKNSQGEYFCPVTYKVFTNNTKIVAIATTGNVFCHEAIEELNINKESDGTNLWLYHL